MFNYKKLSILFILLSSSYCLADDFRVLITNDDGIDSPLIAVLTEKLSQDFDVVVSAPRENQSGSSHASSSSSPLKVEKIYHDEKFFGYGVHGKPADAARFGIMHLGKDKPFDVVVSGINRGSNVGKVSHLSGTVGAAMEGLYHGIPSIAVSQNARANSDISANLALQVVKQIQNKKVPEGVLISINVPAGDVNNVVVKPMGGSYLGFRPFEIVEQDNESITYQSGLTRGHIEVEDNDTKAYQQGVATITPLKLDWTDYTLIEKIDQWQLKTSP